MKKTVAFVISLVLVTVFAVGCSMGKDETVTVSPTVSTMPTVETDNGNVTDDATTDQANDAASDTLMDDVNETVEGETSVEPTAESTDAASAN